MKYLVDTHVLLWSFIDPEQLSPTVLQLLMNENNVIYYSPINLMIILISVDKNMELYKKEGLKIIY